MFSKKNIGLVTDEDGHLTSRDEENVDAFNAFCCLSSQW